MGHPCMCLTPLLQIHLLLVPHTALLRVHLLRHPVSHTVPPSHTALPLLSLAVAGLLLSAEWSLELHRAPWRPGDRGAGAYEALVLHTSACHVSRSDSLGVCCSSYFTMAGELVRCALTGNARDMLSKRDAWSACMVVIVTRGTHRGGPHRVPVQVCLVFFVARKDFAWRLFCFQVLLRCCTFSVV